MKTLTNTKYKVFRLPFSPYTTQPSKLIGIYDSLENAEKEIQKSIDIDIFVYALQQRASARSRYIIETVNNNG